MAESAPATFTSLARGDALPVVAMTIAADDVQAYLDATGAASERWREYVPPLMLDALMLGVLLRQVELPPGLMHTGHEHEARRPVRVGEPLTVRFTVASNAVRAGALFAVFDAEARAGDEVVSTMRANVMSPKPGTTVGGDGAGVEA